MAAVSLQDAKDFLNISSTRDDVELSGFLNAAVGIVEDRVGPLEPTSVTETIFDPHPQRVVLASSPAVSLQSVLVSAFLGQDGVDDTASWLLDSRSGILRRKMVGGYWGYYGPGSMLTVSYTAGRASVPEQLIEAVLFVVQTNWKSQRGASPLPAGGGDDSPASTPGFLIPNRALEAMQPYLLPPGVA